MTDPDRMTDPLATIVSFLLERDRHPGSATPIDSRRWLAGDGPAALSAAFLVVLAHPGEPSAAEARRVFEAPPADVPAGLAELYAQGLRAIPAEVAARRAIDPAFAAELDRAAATLTGPGLDERTARETIWSVLYPEAVGLLDDVPGSVAALRRQRLVH
ncbi:MAG: hypothetical protein ACRDGQ_12140, partial [Candidatus Limnocylindrales bacterium]